MRFCAIAAIVLLAGCEAILGIGEPSLGTPNGEGDGGGVGVPGESQLGLLCGEGQRDNGFDGGCPGESECIFDLFGFYGSPDRFTGYCAPFCGGDPVICEDSYPGPVEDMPTCGIPEAEEAIPPDFCTVGFSGGCETGGGCPDGMECRPMDFMGLPAVGCVPIEWVDFSGGGDGGTAENFLGILCGPNHSGNGFGGGCPTGHDCITSIANFSDPEGPNGYCSPLCVGDDMICQNGYMFPPEGEPRCTLPDPFDATTGEHCGVGFEPIGCETDGDAVCPDGMVCHIYDDGAGGTAFGCGGPSWQAAL